jgi:hypothetical protein
MSVTRSRRIQHFTTCGLLMTVGSWVATRSVLFLFCFFFLDTHRHYFQQNKADVLMKVLRSVLHPDTAQQGVDYDTNLNVWSTEIEDGGDGFHWFIRDGGAIDWEQHDDRKRIFFYCAENSPLDEIPLMLELSKNDDDSTSLSLTVWTVCSFASFSQTHIFLFHIGNGGTRMLDL